MALPLFAHHAWLEDCDRACSVGVHTCLPPGIVPLLSLVAVSEQPKASCMAVDYKLHCLMDCILH
jgi:hypothetical protein